MKKFLAMILALTMVFALCACGTSGSGSTGDTGSNGSNLLTDKDNTGSTGEYITPDEDGFAEGRFGNIMSTKWFDFTINSAYTAAAYDSYTPAAGNMMLIVDCTVKNTFTRSTPMADVDFQAQWGDSAEDAYSTPITDDGTAEGLPVINDEQLPSLYELAIDETRTGKLVYEVPADLKDFSISYVEYDESGNIGDTFAVYFTASTAAAA